MARILDGRSGFRLPILIAGAIEEHFHDVKEIWGGGQQQVRNVWSDTGCWNLCTWLFLLVELETWDEWHEDLVDRGDRPWDHLDRRPSHADPRRQFIRKMPKHRSLKDLPLDQDHEKLRDSFDILPALAA